MSEVSDRIPVGTYWLDKDRTIIAGGNIRKIMDLNNKKVMIGIYFIATGPYKVQIEGFLDSIIKFRPDNKKRVV